MKDDVIERELAGGAPVTVVIAGTARPLRYTMHAVAIYKQLTGDSLFVKENFEKLDLVEDPDRWLKCLWAGLHELQPDRASWKAPLTLAELGGLIDFANATPIAEAMARAMMQALPKGSSDPKAQPLPGAADPRPTSPTSPGSTPAPVADSELVAASS